MATTPEPCLALALQLAFRNARNRDDIIDNIKSISMLKGEGIQQCLD